MYVWFVGLFFLLLLVGLVCLCVALLAPSYTYSSYVYVDSPPPSTTSIALTNSGTSNKTHKALHWDGISSYMNLSNTDGRWDVCNDDFTILLMLRMPAVTTSKTVTILNRWLSDADMPVGYGLSFNATTLTDKLLQLELGDGTTSEMKTFTWSNLNLDDNEWHLIAVSVSRQNAVETMCFMDGNLQGARYNTYLSGASLDDPSVDLSLMIGRRLGPNELAQYWNGDMLLFGILCETPSVTDLVRMRADWLPS